MSPALSSGGRTALWIGGGGLVGLAVGALLTNPGRALELSAVWFAVTLLYLGGVFAFGRAKGQVRPAPMPAPAPPKRMKVGGQPKPEKRIEKAPAAAVAPLHVLIEFPSVPEDFPIVVGYAESVDVRVRVTQAGRPAEGAAVRLEASLGDNAQATDGVAGTDGTIEFQLEPDELGDLVVRAEASLADARGTTEETASVVHYEDEIQRLFGEFRAFAIDVIGPEAEAYTARELAARLRPTGGAEVARATLELARVYELVAYGEREADRRSYLAVMEQLLVLEQADLPAEPKTAPARGA